MHDALFIGPVQLRESDLVDKAVALGLTPGVFRNCMTADSGSVVNEDIQSGGALKVTGTPTFFIGKALPGDRVRVTARLAGAQPIAEFRRAIDPLLKGAQ
jgi:protein-disulfide isomerase